MPFDSIEATRAVDPGKVSNNAKKSKTVEILGDSGTHSWGLKSLRKNDGFIVLRSMVTMTSSGEV